MVLCILINTGFCSVHVDLISPVPCSEELPKRDEFVENTDTYGATITNASFCETGE